MNYKEALRAWLVNPEIKLEYRRGKEDKWYQLFFDFPGRTPVFYADTEYRVKATKARVALCGEAKLVISEDKYEEVMGSPLFEKWISDEFELYT